MTCGAEPTARLLAALRAHPRATMTATELAAKLRGLPAAAFAEALATARADKSVCTHTVASPDPHLPAIEAVALVLGPPTDPKALAEAGHRAAQCAQVLQRQLMRSHRCQ